jgi:hypothetical protein
MLHYLSPALAWLESNEVSFRFKPQNIKTEDVSAVRLL